MSIIIVDDNVTNQLIIKTILNKAGYSNLLIASSAKQLYELLHLDTPYRAEEGVDLILMDMMMPGIDGLEACRRIQTEERYRDVPIIFVTAVGDSNKLAEALDAGASDYVMKPINKLELLARIRSALRLKYEKDWHKEQDKRIKYELDLAKQVQRSVLSAPIEDENIHIAAVYQPSFELAGDYYAWFRIDKHRYGVILLDMMGHGISSSLVCMFISSVLKDMITRVTDPEKVMRELNRYMGQLYRSDELLNYYFTSIFVVVDTESKQIEYVNAGHPPGLVITESGAALLEPSAPAIGLFENIDVAKGTISYEGETSIILYTDGLLEEMVESDDAARRGKIVDLTRTFASKSPSEIVEELLQGTNDSAQRDDICMVRISIK
ncbi:fused response regulator/phosphatase [Paenibacillus sp. GSMTC-2017]|uniref:SpoIIE family protein phosphatase n=1 Tax=Paenibacillus sp. GSMTC-2017 TaxID=2794350 RepID=UPI0018D805CB|nr:fused response regulator/phosphatase [Paenibacillus sp. GSMTC-2017]MBH5319948.1 fused response regulator/phosphatase [Paenibacillus sp. GSMTC-2017]